MLLRKILIPVIILFLAFFANFIWLLEVNVYIGWAGTTWGHVEQYSIFVINGLAILAYCLPFWLSKKDSNRHRLKTFVLLYLATLLAFYLMKGVLSLLFSPMSLFLLFNSEHYFYISLIFSAFFYAVVINPFILNRISNRMLKPLPKVQFLLFFFGFILTVPLSLVSIHFLPGYGYGKNWIDAIKMGYFYFWIIIIMGIIGVLSKRFFHVFNNDIEDILDL